jgi:hypothetical protein
VVESWFDAEILFSAADKCQEVDSMLFDCGWVSSSYRVLTQLMFL